MSSELLLTSDRKKFIDRPVSYLLKADYSVFATQLFNMNMTQANPYCFEFKFNRMNPLNLTNEDFGAIEIYKSTYRRDPQQRSREFFRQFKLTQIATILPNETYVSFPSVRFLRFRA